MASSPTTTEGGGASTAVPGTVLRVRDVTKRFTLGRRGVQALDRVSMAAPAGSVTALLGPDGAGKTTLLRLAAGLLAPDGGEVEVLGLDAARQALAIQSRIGYMPQKFGLYEDLSVQENLDLYADLQGVTRADRRERYPQLMRMTGLAPFTKRLAGRLSGGMKQKLGLACTLVRSPDLLLLDEPTAGVDPVSRRELWEIVYRLVRDEGVTVVLSTAYLDEAERCDNVVILHHGRVLGEGPPEQFHELAQGRCYEATDGDKPRRIQRRLMVRAEVVDATIEAGRARFVARAAAEPGGADFADLRVTALPPRLEDGFMILLNEARQREQGGTGEAAPAFVPSTATEGVRPARASPDEVVVRVQKLTRRFGDFYAVREIDFDVRRGEIFGLLGPNGAGKSTTFRMLCGLLPVSGGHLEVAGVDLRRARAAARARVGYVAQKFSQYGQLSARENLRFFSSVYGLRGRRQRDRIDWAVREFALTDLLDVESRLLPGGYKQRLAMACALMHEPEILFLDEPTSGVDPLARREFWHRITDLADAGVTVIITTHFMEEAEYCDRLAIMIGGRVLAIGTPDEIRAEAGPRAAIEDAFIALVERARHGNGAGRAGGDG